MALNEAEESARIELRRKQVDGEGAHYEVRLELPGGEVRGALFVAAADGAVRVDPLPEDVPVWVVSSIAPLARTLWTTRRREDVGDWPRRLHRWRKKR